MKHELIMENWRRYVDQHEDPDLLEEGFIQNALLALSVAMAPQAAQAALYSPEAPHKATQIQGAKLQQLKQAVTDLFMVQINDTANPPTDQEKSNMERGLKKILQQLDVASKKPLPGRQYVDSKSTFGGDQGAADIVTVAFSTLKDRNPTVADQLDTEVEGYKKMLASGEFNQEAWDKMSVSQKRQYLAKKTADRFDAVRQHGVPGADRIEREKSAARGQQ